MLGAVQIAEPMKANRIAEAANRREFLRGSLRYSLLAGLAAVSAALLRRRGSRLANQTCVNESICRGCAVFDDCGLPQALSAKQIIGRSRRGNEADSRVNRQQTPPTDVGVYQTGGDA